MKKQLIITFAICVLFLSACGSLVGTGGTSSTTATHAPSTVTLTRVDCRVLQVRQTSIRRDIQSVSAQLSTAAARGNQTTIGQVEQTLIRLHWLLSQEQAWLKACPAIR